MLRHGWVVVFASVVGASCGDPILPANYGGVPAATVTGITPPVQGAPAGSVEAPADAKDKKAPRIIALQWFDGRNSADKPISQRVIDVNHRSDDVFDIAFGPPVSTASFDLPGGSARIAVAKMFDFSDGNGNGTLDWNCVGPNCDVIRSVSRQFMVYVEVAPDCSSDRGRITRMRMTTGYHYFTMVDSVLVESSLGAPIEFDPMDASPLDSDPTPVLEQFTGILAASFASGILGC